MHAYEGAYLEAPQLCGPARVLAHLAAEALRLLGVNHVYRRTAQHMTSTCTALNTTLYSSPQCHVRFYSAAFLQRGV